MKIDPQYVRECYIKHGLKPACGNAHVRAGTCCAIGAVVFDKLGNTDKPYEQFGRLFPDVKGGAFFCGFDDAITGRASAPTFADSDDYTNGYAAAEAVKDLK